jgi:hypothetical protein
MRTSKIVLGLGLLLSLKKILSFKQQSKCLNTSGLAAFSLMLTGHLRDNTMTEDYFMQLYQEAERRLEAQPKPTPTPEKEDKQNDSKT